MFTDLFLRFCINKKNFLDKTKFFFIINAVYSTYLDTSKINLILVAIINKFKFFTVCQRRLIMSILKKLYL